MQTENGGDVASPADAELRDENVLTDNAADAGTPPAAEPDAKPPEAEAKPTAEPKPKGGWAQKRIDELTREKHESAREAQRLRDELAAARELIEKGKPAEDGTAAPTQRRNETDADFEARVAAEAERRAGIKAFNDACNKTFAEGTKSFPDFQDAVSDLHRAGVMVPDFLEAVIETEAPHKVLHHLGQDPAEAQRIAALSPKRMAIELDRLSHRLEKPEGRPVSQAPAPITPVRGSAKADFDPEGDFSMEDYVKWREANRKTA